MRLLQLSLLLVVYQLLDAQQLQNGGIFVRLNQKAVDYIADLVSEAMPRLLNQLNPADTQSGPAKISKTLIHTVNKPQTNISFIEGKGFRADVVFPYIRVSSDLAVSVFIFEYAGSFSAELHNLSLEMELHYSRNETTNRNIIEAPHCAVNHTDLVISFPPDSTLATIRNELEDQIITKLRSAFCDVAVQALQFVDDQDLEEAVEQEPVESDGTEFRPAELGYSLCKAKTVVEEEPTSPAPTLVPTEITINNSSISWSANLSLAFPPIFRKDDVIFGINGGVIMNGEPAHDISMPPTDFNRTHLDSQMIGIAISEYVPNTLLSHIYDNDLGRFSETFTADHLPKALKKLGKLVCSKCFLTLAGSLVEKPFIEVDKQLGARIRIAANLSISFHGREDRHELIQATTTLHVTVKPTIRHSRVYGDVSLSSVDVNVFELAVSGALAKPLEQAVSFIVPKVLWPQVKRRLRFALNRRGFQLPVICGLEFEQMKLFYVDHAMVLTTNFQFDLDNFVGKFKRYLQYKASMNPSLPKYLDMD